MLLRPLPTQSEHSHVGNSGWQSTQNGRMLTPRVVEHALDESRWPTLMLGVRTLRLPGTIEACRELAKTAPAATPTDPGLRFRGGKGLLAIWSDASVMP